MACIARFQHPANMSVEYAVSRRVRIERRIFVAMMGAMDRRPPDGGPFEGKIACQYPEVLNDFGAGERPVRQQPVVTDCHTHRMPDVKEQE